MRWEKHALALWQHLVHLLRLWRQRDDDWSVLGHRVHIRGKITSGGELEICGRVEGDIEHTGRLIVGPGGRCISNIHADELRIAGEVHGNVYVEDLLELMPTGRLYGDMVCGLLRVHPGGTMLGAAQMTDAVASEPVRLPARPEPALALALAGPLAVLAEPVSGSEPAGPFRQRRVAVAEVEPETVLPEREPLAEPEEPLGAARASVNDAGPAFYGGFYPAAPPQSHD